MEGLIQKGWTLTTLLLILIPSCECGTIATLTGQGDNQVYYISKANVATLEGLRMTRYQFIAWFQETLLDLRTKAGITPQVVGNLGFLLFTKVWTRVLLQEGLGTLCSEEGFTHVQ